MTMTMTMATTTSIRRRHFFVTAAQTMIHRLRKQQTTNPTAAIIASSFTTNATTVKPVVTTFTTTLPFASAYMEKLSHHGSNSAAKDEKDSTVASSPTSSSPTSSSPSTSSPTHSKEHRARPNYTSVRLNKYMVLNNYAMSRRDADLYINNGWVKINGSIVSNQNYGQKLFVSRSTHEESGDTGKNSSVTTITISKHEDYNPAIYQEQQQQQQIDAATTTKMLFEMEDPNILYDPTIELLPQAMAYEQKNRGTTVIFNKPLGILSGLFGNEEHKQSSSIRPTAQYKPAIKLLTQENMYVPKYRRGQMKSKQQQQQEQQQQQQQEINSANSATTTSSSDDQDDTQPEATELSSSVDADEEQQQQQPPSISGRRIIEPYTLPKMAVAGRLDINTTGLLLFTQDGTIASRAIGPNSMIEKEYLVRISSQPMNLNTDYSFSKYYVWDPNKAMEELQEKVELLRKGIQCGRDFLEAKSVDILHSNSRLQRLERTQQSPPQFQLRVVLTQGKKHHIRRMMEQIHYNIQALKRVRIGGIKLGSLPIGTWRYKYVRETL